MQHWMKKTTPHKGQSYTTRIRHSQKLRDAFLKLSVDLYDIDHHAGKPLILLREADIKISMDGRGRYLDNIFIERLWRSLKQEAVYLHEITNGFQAKQDHRRLDRLLQR